MTRILRNSIGLTVVATLAGGAACTRDDGLQRQFGDRVSVVLGDFDDVSSPFKRMDVRHDVFEGLISNATWDPSFEPANVDLKVEDLFLGNDGAGQFSGSAAVFVGSGTRGFGDRQYNGLGDDDQLVNDPRIQENTQRYVSRGGPLLVTDWAYELVETSWPDAIDFLGDDPQLRGDGWSNLDAAQLGVIDQITADIVDSDLADALGSDTMALDFPYSNFALMQDVGPDVTVHVRGDLSYQVDELADIVELTDIPLLVSFQPDGQRGGTVFYSVFHVDAQNAALMDAMLVHFFGEFEPERVDATVQ